MNIPVSIKSLPWMGPKVGDDVSEALMKLFERTDPVTMEEFIKVRKAESFALHRSTLRDAERFFNRYYELLKDFEVVKHDEDLNELSTVRNKIYYSAGDGYRYRWAVGIAPLPGTDDYILVRDRIGPSGFILKGN